MSTSSREETEQTESHELGQMTRGSPFIVNSNPDLAERPTQELKPTDGGRAAWTLLLAAFIFEALFWGMFESSFITLQRTDSEVKDFPAASESFKTSTRQFLNSKAIPTFHSSVPSHKAFIIWGLLFLLRFPKHQRHQIWFGWPMCILGLLAGSFTSSIGGLIATQGILYGLGFVVLTYPIISMVNEWWISRKGMAFGMISAASGLTGAVMPFIIDTMLHKYGYRTTLRASAVAMAVLTLPLIPLLKGRLPVTDQAHLAPTDWSFLTKPLFWIYAFGIVIQGLGFFFPPVYLPSYASAIGISSLQAALLLALMSIAQVLGQFAFGYLSDTKLPVTGLAIVCSVLAGIATLTMWGFGKSIALLAVFAIFYGFFAFAFGTMRVGMAKTVSNDQSALLAMYSIFVFLQGIGNVLVGPISARLLSGGIYRDAYAAGMYKTLVVFTGVTSFLSAIVILLWPGYGLFAKPRT